MTSNNFVHLISADVAWKYRVIPIEQADNKLSLLIDATCFSETFVNELEMITGYEVTLVKEDREIIHDGLSRFYRKDLHSSKVNTRSRTESVADDFLQKIIDEAKELKSSDIHVEGYSTKCRIRLRIDGRLIERYSIPKEQYVSFVNKIKIKANLDIAEKRLPQDGRIMIQSDSGRTDIRVSIMPSLHGEKVVLRLLGSDSSHLSIEDLGLDSRQLEDVLRVIKRLQGIVLISGPTGSGKTTTLYSILKLLNKDHSNILTIEDPIEYTIDGVNQVQLRDEIGLTFSSALRTFLRQDPDIIMLGEIRDGETAQMAIRAALTGHLVLSTIHTNSAWGTITRLVDMGVPPFLLSNTLNMTVAQRLVRKLCRKCKTMTYSVPSDVMERVSSHGFESNEKHFVSNGCQDCYFTGYAGRMAIYEAIPIDKELCQFVKENVQDISEHLEKRKIFSLQQSAINLVKEGTTSFEEIYPILLNM